MKKDVLFCKAMFTLLCLSATQLYAQPKITSFSPASGHVNTTLTITGSGFNTGPAGNTVIFGPVKTSVLATSATSITVIVPTGTATQNISVVNNATGLTGYSATQYSTYYTTPFESNIIPAFLQPRIDLTTGYLHPGGANYSDLDDDGKPDLLFVDVPSAVRETGTVAIWKNGSAQGNLSASSFTPAATLSPGQYPGSVTPVDLDGDSKPDLIITLGLSNRFTVLRNVATQGTLNNTSFSGAGTISLALDSYSLTTGDADADGRPDIIVGYTSGTISIFRNLGGLNFAPAVNYSTGYQISSIRSADLDGDGKQELVAIGYAISTDPAVVTVLRNTSTAGTLNAASFAPKTDFVLSGPISIGSIFIGDADGDGKPDLLTNLTSQGAGTGRIAVLWNTSTSGIINAGSFAPETDFAAGNRPGAVRLADVDGDGKSDILFTNEAAGTTQAGISFLINTGSPGSITPSSFTARKFIPADYVYGVDFLDLDTDGKPEVVTNVNAPYNYATYSNTFSSIFKIREQPYPFTITSVTPGSSPAGTIVTITGNQFNPDPSANIVFFGAVKAIITGGSSSSLTVIVPKGATYQQVSVLNTATGLTAYSSQAFIPAFTNPAPTGIAPGFYQPKLDVSAGFPTGAPAAAYPYSFAFGDIDGDGRPDMAVVHANSNTVTVLQNNSSNGVLIGSAFNSKTNFAAGPNPLGVQIRDMDGDGKPDLVIVKALPDTALASGTVSVLRNTSTTGTINSGSFAPKVEYDIAYTGSPFSVAIDDVDSDGKPDIIAGNSANGTVTIYRNSSSPGSITAASFATKQSFAVSGGRAVAVGDLDGDGKPDIVATDQNNSSIRVLHNETVNSSPSPLVFSFPSYYPTGSTPNSVVISDVDGDGRPDVLVGNFGSNTVSVLRNIPSSNSFNLINLSPATDFATGDQPFAISAGDADGDGKPDIISANAVANTLSILRNTATSGVINASSFAPKVDFATGAYPVSVAIADLDGDGIAEAAALNAVTNNVSILKITGPIGFTPVVLSFTPAKAQAGTPITINGAYFNNNPSANIVYFGAVKAQVTGGGSSSIITTVPAGASYQAITVLNSAIGLTAIASNPFMPTFTNPFGANVPANFYQPKVDYTTGALPYGVAVSDVDGDGKPDMVTANFNSNTISVLRNISTTGSLDAASFGSKTDFATGTNPYALAIGDFDGDGKPDIAVANYGAGSMSVLKNTAVAGSITAASFAPKTDFSTGVNSYPISIAAGDVNTDGRVDLVTANPGTQTVSVFNNTSTKGIINAGTFAAPFNLSPGGRPRCVLIGDVDADFRMDIIVAYENTGKISVSLNTGTSSDLTIASFPIATFFDAGSEPYAIAYGDLNADGKPDIVVANHSSAVATTLSALRNTSVFGSVSFAPKENLPSTGTAPFAVTIGDVNGDGEPDVVAANSVSNTISVLRHKPGVNGTSLSAIFDPAVQFATGNYPLSVVVNDLNGDGTAEVITSNAASTVSVFKIGSPSFSAVQATAAEGIAGKSLEESGRNIALFPNPSTGAFTLQLMNLKAPVAAIEVLNASGKTVQRRSVGLTDRTTSLTMQLSLAGQPAGVYYVKVTSVDGVQIVKVVLQR